MSYQVAVSGVSKNYIIGSPLSILFPSLTKSPFITALKDITFAISPGERVGIVGRNGSGKSTLLKLLCGCSSPTTGKVKVNGKISAILELGTGFSPGSSVLDNARMGLICQGVIGSSLNTLVEQVLTFSELSEFSDRQFSTLSSGMQARLMISTALAQTPELLIVDEALATGDALFQSKCLERVRKICDEGATVVFVTHSLSLLYQFCTRGILLHKGRMLADGMPKDVGRRYEALLENESKRSNSNEILPEESTVHSPYPSRASHEDRSLSAIKTDHVIDATRQNTVNLYKIAKSGCEQLPKRPDLNTLLSRPPSIVLRSHDGDSVSTLNYGNQYELSISFEFDSDCGDIDIGYRICTAEGMPVTGDTIRCHGYLALVNRGAHTVNFSFASYLGPGSYILDYGIVHVQPGSLAISQICFERLGYPIAAHSDNLVNGIFANPSSAFRVVQ
jgi:lipopolysaccharide transport system ATP-binding protein